jgi:hypothetical protein
VDKDQSKAKKKKSNCIFGCFRDIANPVKAVMDFLMKIVHEALN